MDLGMGIPKTAGRTQSTATTNDSCNDACYNNLQQLLPISTGTPMHALIKVQFGIIT